MDEFVELIVDVLDYRNFPIVPRGGYYRPHLSVGPDHELMGIHCVDGDSSIAPGSCGRVIAKLVYPGVDYSPLQPEVECDMVEGPHVVARVRLMKRWSEETSQAV